MWTKQMMDTVACEKILGRLYSENKMLKEKKMGQFLQIIIHGHMNDITLCELDVCWFLGQ